MDRMQSEHARLRFALYPATATDAQITEAFCKKYGKKPDAIYHSKGGHCAGPIENHTQKNEEGEHE